MNVNICRNCGATNPLGSLTCRVCQVPLTGTFAMNAAEESNKSGEQIECKNCGTMNSPSAVVCTHCHAPLHGSLAVGGGSPSPAIKENKVVCLNCGHRNSPSALNCENCNAPLKGSLVQQNHEVAKADKPIVHPEETTESAKGLKHCEKCGYPNISTAIFCSHCNHKLGEEVSLDREEDAFSPDKTINPWSKTPLTMGALTLTPLNENGEEESAVSFDEGRHTLNRSTLQSENRSITSEKQAEIFAQGQQWFIKDHSKHQATYVLASRPMPIGDGDVILLGDQRFRVSLESKNDNS